MPEEQPWQKHKQLGYGVTLDCSHPGRTKKYKVRLRLRSKVLNLGRFAHAHDARLAYDQVIRGLGLDKPTNYCPGDYELDNPEVEAKLEQFRKEHPDAVAKALAAAALAATVTAEDGETKTTVHDEVPEHGTEAAARGTDAAAADAGVSACDADMTEAAAPSVTPVAEADPAAAVTIVSEVTPAAAAAAEPEQASAGSPESSSACCTTDTSNSNSSSPCSSDNKPHSSAACQELSATEHASTPFSGLQQLQLQQPLVSGPTPSPAAAAAAAVEAYEQQPKDAADAAAANSSITSILPKSDAAATGAADVAAADAGDLLSQFETIMQLPDVSQLPDVHQLPDVPQLPDIPQLQLTFDDLPWVQQQQQQLECNHSLLGPLYSFSLGQPAATAVAVGPAAATDPAALAAAVVPASEILAAWVSSQGQDQSNQQQQQQQESCAEPPVRTRTLPVRRTRTCSNLGVRSSSSRAASEPLSGAKRIAKRTKSLAGDDFRKTVAAAADAAAAPVACQTAAAPAGLFAAAAADSSSGSCFEAYMPASLAADAAYANSLQAQPAFTAAAYEAAVAAAAAAARPVQPSVCSAMQPTLCAAGCGSSCGVYCAAAAAAVGEVHSWQQPVAAATAASYAAGPGHFAADELELLQLVLHSRPMLS